jgi:hypothetical protein
MDRSISALIVSASMLLLFVTGAQCQVQEDSVINKLKERKALPSALIGQPTTPNQDSVNLLNTPLRPWFQFSTLGCEGSDVVKDQYFNATCRSSHPPAYMTADVEGGVCLPAIYSENKEGMIPAQSRRGLDTYVEIENIGPSPPPGHPERVGFLAVLHTVDDPKTKYKVYFYNPQSLSLDQIRQDCFRSSPEREKSQREQEAKDSVRREQEALRASEAKAKPFQVVPRLGKPTYSETASWLMENAPKLSANPPIKAMENCVIQYGSGLMIPLSDVSIVVDEPGTGYFSGSERFITFHMKHAKEQYISHAQDYDSMVLAPRVVKALNHAVSLCSKPDLKIPGPF